MGEAGEVDDVGGVGPRRSRVPARPGAVASLPSGDEDRLDSLPPRRSRAARRGAAAGAADRLHRHRRHRRHARGHRDRVGSGRRDGHPGGDLRAGGHHRHRGAGGDTDAGVDCAVNSCSLTLSGDGARADVLGTPVTLGTVQDGRATVRVGDREVSCSQGESVAAGPLTLECTTVTPDTVTLTASLG